ncbi:type VI secretion system protein TssA [Variovorax paradoxus]|uniref:Type VI secretion system protein TssA n=1 Tax=Variovorax paradoxus TaxID=34073 RepID=A0A5Q0MBJ8_VARPD|nr:type VI secretion system ImpA family N-terminal domain-containing protein [Variovorax paradoxus]QFZ85855.1 type VI secretion system protein TssA [Variovorax paradoxus]
MTAPIHTDAEPTVYAMPARIEADNRLSPFSAAAPCGPSLEYDAEYAVLLARMAPRGDAQYGQFVGAPDAPNWAEIERDCRRLLLRTRDINLFVWLCRARTRLAQAPGLAQSLVLLVEALKTWPDAVHPQLMIEGERDPAVRANALAALADPEGLLSDIREVVVAANAARHLTVREVERAFAMPRSPDAASPESMTQQLADLAVAASGGDQAPLRLLAQAGEAAAQIVAWATQHLGQDAPPLHTLVRLLAPFQRTGSSVSPDVVATMPGPLPPWPATPPVGEGLVARDDILRDIRKARRWFESHEPSSPVAVLLKQAERMTGLRFSQVADAIPLDLLRKWDADEEVSL